MQVAGDRRRRELDLQVVHVVAVLVADQQRVAEAGGGDQAGAPGLALDQGVGDQRRGVDDRRRDVGRAHAGLGEQLRDAAAHAVERADGVVSVLSTTTRAGGGVEQHDVGERAADVDGQPPVAVASVILAEVGSRWGEHVEDPALAVLVVADEHRVAVPHLARREVHLAGVEHDALARRRGSPMRKSSSPRTTMPSCSLSAWWCRNEPVAPPVIRQKHICRFSPVTTRRRKPGRSVSRNASSSRK